MKTIEIIKPVKAFEFKKTRVAVYARVSVEGEMNMHSLEAQVDYYNKLIKHNPRWENAGIFADYGLTGTRTDRPGFQGLLKLCDEGKVDLVLTKSISRFARNTVDLLTTVRHLKDLNINVHFEKEGLDSISEQGELMLSLMATFAQEESRSISENLKWGIRKRFEKGIGNKFFLYGYRWNGKEFEINPEQARIVKQIYSDYLSGMTPQQIAKKLTSQGVPSTTGCGFSYSLVWDILRLENYKGDSMLQKTYRENHLTKRKMINHGELPRFYAEGTHPQIIADEEFDAVQAEIKRRAALGYQANQSITFSCFTGKLVCAYCGKTFRKRMHGMKGRLKKYYKWVCSTKIEKTASNCNAQNVPDKILRSLTSEVLNTQDFTDEQFNAEIDHIEVSRTNTLTYFMTNGTKVTKTWLSASSKEKEAING